MRVLSSEQMKICDAHTIEGGVAGITLMHRVAEALFNVYPTENKKIYILCGKGNNGGDGYALACIMAEKNCCFEVFATDDSKGDALYFRNKYISDYGKEVKDIENCDYKCDIIYDCIFGTGFRGDADGRYAEIFENVNGSGAYIVSADIPSGLNSDNGRAGKACVNADITVAVQALKSGHLLRDGKDVCGKCVVADVGIVIPDGYGASLVDRMFVAALFPERKNNVNKGTFGRATIIGGSINYPGAVKLANLGLSALQSGCGLSMIAVPGFLMQPLATVIYESTLFPLTSDGKSIIYNAAEVETVLQMSRALALGMGIGSNHNEINKLISHILASDKKIIIDADGLNCISRNIQILRGHKADVLVTPHPAEMARLCGMQTDDVLNDPVGTAKKFAKDYNVTVLLKGSTTVVTDGEKVSFMKDGGPCLSKGGSGDVLSGVICGLAASGNTLFDSACAGSYLCAVAGNKVKEEFSDYGVLPSAVARAVKDIISAR